MSQKKILFVIVLIMVILVWSLVWGNVLLLVVLMVVLVQLVRVKMESKSMVDYSKLKELQKKFVFGLEVIKVCLGCYIEVVKQVQYIKYWIWEYIDIRIGQKLGKKNIINNYCMMIIFNEKDCMVCYVGYGWKDVSFDFKVEENVDCLICYDSIVMYCKLLGDVGYLVYECWEFLYGFGKFVEVVDLQKVVQSVVMFGCGNCGLCYFYGVGGDGIKYGDFDSQLKNLGKYFDVYMDVKGLNFICLICYVIFGYQVFGSCYEMKVVQIGLVYICGKLDVLLVFCQFCYGDKLYKESILYVEWLNIYSNKVVCQICYIFEFVCDSIGIEMVWDWLMVIRMGLDGKLIFVKDSVGCCVFDLKKGNFIWDFYLVFEYCWFNGYVSYKMKGDLIDLSGIVEINYLEGKLGDFEVCIWLFKIYCGKQVYDMENKYLLVVYMVGEDDIVLWCNFDWQKVIEIGMKIVDLFYSGKFGFVSIEMSWLIIYMVVLKVDVLGCV